MDKPSPELLMATLEALEDRADRAEKLNAEMLEALKQARPLVKFAAKDTQENEGIYPTQEFGLLDVIDALIARAEGK